MATAQETFESAVIEPLRVSVGASRFSYADYLDLPAGQRSNDEAAVVDMQFTSKVLEWLGYDTGDVIYNRPLSGSPGNKPDFIVKALGATAFVVEDKSTDEKFDEQSVEQLRRYTAGTTGYCLWTNGRIILGLRFDANGQYQVIVEVRVEGTFGNQKLLFPQEANFATLYFLFCKQRFTDIAILIDEVAIPEEQWRKEAKPLTDERSLKAFIVESRFVLDQLVTNIEARLSTVAIDMDEAVQDVKDSQQRYSTIVTSLINQLGNSVRENTLKHLETHLRLLEPVLTDIDIVQIERLKPSAGVATETIWTTHVQEISALISALRTRELARMESRRIRAAYLIWRERYKVIEGDDGKEEAELEIRRQRAFAEQVSYVFFVRLLLIRVLEDKGIIPHLVSDGGFQQWHKFLQGYTLDSIEGIGGESFLPLAYRRVSGFYRHFFQQPIFDWFLPDDYLLALVLHHLNQYNFQDVTSDVLGFTYESFIERVARNKKGHFLTPPGIVEFMLDRADYRGPSIIGETVLDPACGSGSFLVHAIRRLRQVLKDTMASQSPVEVARTFIEQVQTRFVGLEINPFSCYLAELNLFIQILDDLALLWQTGEAPHIERFAIYNTNSLEMPRSVLFSDRNGLATTFEEHMATLDEGFVVKEKQAHFSYVLCNPPYVNRGIILGAKSYGDFPFYRDVVKGDENFYLLFLRLAAYYVSPGGTICIICPLNLLGDESTMRAREMFSKADWSLKAVTRFYARDVLFSEVLQGVCVARFDKISSQLTNMVEIRGGFSVEEAARTAIHIQQPRITHNFPENSLWAKPWLVNANPEAYDLWEFIREKTNQSLSDLIDGKLKVHEGDARSTWAKPMLIPHPQPGSIPLTKGQNITDWGGWTPSAYLNPSATIPNSMKDYRSSLWVQRQVQRIAQLQQAEIALFLKEVSGLEMKRPIRGTIIQRDGQHPVVADHTVLVMYTVEEAHRELAYAIFGLITSLCYNYFFSLFSTNAHANFKEILRLPVPNWSSSLEKQLADQARKLLRAYRDLYSHEAQYGSNPSRQVSANDVLVSAKLPVLRLEELVLRGDVSMSGSPQYTLKVLFNKGQLAINDALPSDAKQAIECLIQANGMLIYSKGGKDIYIPNPRLASVFLSQLHTAQQERARRLRETENTQQALDAMIMDMYGITKPTWREIIQAGVPWARD